MWQWLVISHHVDCFHCHICIATHAHCHRYWGPMLYRLYVHTTVGTVCRVLFPHGAVQYVQWGAVGTDSSERLVARHLHTNHEVAYTLDVPRVIVSPIPTSTSKPTPTIEAEAVRRSWQSWQSIPVRVG